MLLAAYGGLRFGELAGLRRSRIDILGGRVVVAETLVENDGHLMFGPPKTKRSRRTVPLPRRVVAELEEHLDRYVPAAPDALVFTGPKGAPLRRSGFHRRWWVPAVNAIGADGLNSTSSDTRSLRSGSLLAPTPRRFLYGPAIRPWLLLSTATDTSTRTRNMRFLTAWTFCLLELARPIRAPSRPWRFLEATRMLGDLLV